MPGETFPRSLREFYRRFPDETSCIEFVRDSRWPGGVLCPRCSGSRGRTVPGRPCSWRCHACAYTFSAISGTVMENTKLPLAAWLQAAYLLVTDKRGISAKQLQRDLGL